MSATLINVMQLKLNNKKELKTSREQSDTKKRKKVNKTISIKRVDSVKDS